LVPVFRAARIALRPVPQAHSVTTARVLALPTVSVNAMVSLVAVLASSLIAVAHAAAMVPMTPALVALQMTSTSPVVAVATVLLSEDDK
jgi:hypothetical protein